MVFYCNCPICNMTEDGHQEAEQAYVEWIYEQYCKETENPLSMNDWLDAEKKEWEKNNGV